MHVLSGVTPVTDEDWTEFFESQRRFVNDPSPFDGDLVLNTGSDNLDAFFRWIYAEENDSYGGLK